MTNTAQTTSVVSVFNFDSTAIRVLMDENDKPLFIANDVAAALGYSRTNDAINQHCDGAVKHRPIVDSLGRTQQARVIYEPDVYRLIFGSKLDSAVNFQDWVFEQVLPSIRRTGGYAADRHVAELEARLARMESLLTVRNYGDVHPKAVDNDQSKQAVLNHRKNWRVIYDFVNDGLNSIEIGIKLNLDSSGIRRIIRQMRACGILPPDPRQAACELEKELRERHQATIAHRTEEQ